MRAPSLQIVAALGLAAALGGCNTERESACYRVQCPYPPVYHDSYAGYFPALTNGRPVYGEPPFDDPFADYTQRSVTISPGAGNAQAANTALQTATPWPRYSNNTNIPGNGADMVNAIHNYETHLTSTGGGGGGPTNQNNNTTNIVVPGASSGGGQQPQQQP